MLYLHDRPRIARGMMQSNEEHKEKVDKRIRPQRVRRLREKIKSGQETRASQPLVPHKLLAWKRRCPEEQDGVLAMNTLRKPHRHPTDRQCKCKTGRKRTKSECVCHTLHKQSGPADGQMLTIPLLKIVGRDVTVLRGKVCIRRERQSTLTVLLVGSSAAGPAHSRGMLGAA